MIPTSPMRLPIPLRDPSFVRRIAALHMCTNDTQRNMILWTPLVAERPFNPLEITCHCPRGHVGEHLVGDPPTKHDGQAHRARQCTECDASWLERIE